MTPKNDLRRRLRLERPAASPVDATAVARQLMANSRVSRAHTLLLYSALPDEVPTLKLIEQLAADGKTVVLPRVVSATDMELRRYTGRHDLQPGAFGILEPTGERFSDDASIDVAIVPGMAFDREGHRLGRGKGYYDRWLAGRPHIYKIGLCYDWQLVDRVPTDNHDVTMDEVVVVMSEE